MKPPETGGESSTAMGLWELTMSLHTLLSWIMCHLHCSIERLPEPGYPHPTRDAQLQLWVPAVEWGAQEGAALLGPLCAGAAPVWEGRVWWLCAEAPGGSWALTSPPAPGWLLSQQGELPAVTHMLWSKQWCCLTFKILVRRKLVSCLVFVPINVLFSYYLVTTINS